MLQKSSGNFGRHRPYRTTEGIGWRKRLVWSRKSIIITSRDSRVLLNHGVKEEHIYRPELLDDENSFKLFESIGEQKEYATYMWEGCGLYPETAIAELQERSLVSINKHDEFEMHDLVGDMGRGIVSQQGSLKSLVHLDLRRCSTLQRLPDSICMLMSLKTLILIGCNSLSSLPKKLGDMKSLRELLADYTGIRTIPDSVGDLSNLRTLSLSGNYHLEKLPDSIRTLDSLEELYIINHVAGWSFDGLNLINLDSVLCLNEYTGAFKSLGVIPNSACEKVKELTIEDGLIRELPPYLGRLTNLEALSIRCCKLRSLPEWLGQLRKLKSFELVSYSLDSIGEGLSLASSVEELYISCWSIEALPVTAGRTFENLRSIELNCPLQWHNLSGRFVTGKT
ncbi:Plant intracellular Ras-group-related LRR protein 4 [Nymphaea thermarum]|nr:Plant intracellular Ras-group-related LRR protein 4 [Nymphaea thermarum]